MTEPRTWDHPTSPAGVTRVTDVAGRIWERRDDRWTTPGAGHCHWHVLLDEFGPLTEVLAPALPTELGSIIRANGMSSGMPFKDVVLIRDLDGYWHGDVAGGYVDLSLSMDRIDTFTVLATYDPATQAVVPREEWEALKSEVRSVVASAGADLDPDPYIARKARALVRAAEEAER